MKKALFLLLLLYAPIAAGQQLTCLGDLAPATLSQGHSRTYGFCVFDQKLFFCANGQPWLTDGTAAGTQLLQAVTLPEYGTQQPFLVAGGQLFFLADDGVHGRELWVSDGTPAGTHMVADINPVVAGPQNTGWMAALHDRILFDANDGIHGDELWVSDGTDTGTYLLKDMRTGTIGSEPGGFLPIDGGRLIFAATGNSLNKSWWVTDGTDTGTHVVKDAAQHDALFGLEAISFGRSILYRGGYTPVSADLEPWISDGTPAGTHVLKELFDSTGSLPSDFVAYGGKAYFRAMYNPAPPAQYGYYETDGTDTGTHRISHPVLYGPVFLNGRWYGSAQDEAGGWELWSADSNGNNMSRVRDLEPGKAGSNPGAFTVFHQKIYFTAATQPYGRVLWQSDGTDTGTHEVLPANWSTAFALGWQGMDTRELGVFDGALYFAARYDARGVEPWRLDPDGPLEVTAVPPPAAVHLFPNPATDRVRVEGVSVQQAWIYNVAGQLAGTVTGNDWAVGQLPPGYYGVRIVDRQGQRWTGRFLKLY